MQTTAFRTTSLVIALFAILFSMAVPAQADSASIAGSVFIDSNNNGLYDAADKALEGAELTLVAVTGQSERIISQIKTDLNGAYQFNNLSVGAYYLQSLLPPENYYSIPVLNGSAALPSSGQESRTPLFTLDEGQAAVKNVIAIKRSAYINMIAFGDENMNGGRMSNEPLLRDVNVELIYEWDGIPYVIAMGSTNRDGELQFRDLTPATYRIAVTMPEPYIIGPLGQKINPFYNVIPPTEGNQGLSEPFTLERSVGLGIGGVKAGTLKGKIWFDSNMDGRMDASETGQSGILLTLTHLRLGVTRTQLTTQSAEFTFEYLQAGEYSIKAELPDGIMFALPGSPSVFQNGYNSGQSMNLQVREDGVTVLEPIGVMPASSVTVVAFHDINVNGLPDEGEPAFAGAQVEAIKEDNALASAVTDSQGKAVLPRIRSGEATIRVTLPDGQIFSVYGGDTGNAFSSLSASSSISVQRPLKNGDHLTLFAGATLPSAITGTLFDDSNLSGLMDSNETGLAGFSVQAIDSKGIIAAEVKTGSTGEYLLEGLVPSSYQVRFLLISPYVFSAPSMRGQGTENKVTEQTVEYGQTEPVFLDPGMIAGQIDAGAFRSAVISGAVLLGDEILGYTGQSGGLENVSIELLDEYGQPVSEYTNAKTNEAGAYSLKGALPGTYSLSFTLPIDSKFSQPLVDEITVISEAFQVQASDELALQPLYAVKTGIVSGQAFHDVNNNGSLDETDEFLSQVQVTLRNTVTAETYQVQSNDLGFYELTGIRPGTYEASVQLPEGFSLDANASSLVSPSIDGFASKQIDIQMNGRIENGLLPALKPVLISGIAFYDNDLDKAYSEQEDKPYTAQLSLTHIRTGSIAALTAGPDGKFSTGLMFPGNYLMNLVLPEKHLLISPEDARNQQNSWTKKVTLDESSLHLELSIVQLGSLTGTFWNMDGSMRDIAGLSVKLLDTQDKLLQETFTDKNGQYLFSGLMPIEYKLSAQLPDQYRFARLVDTASQPSVILSDDIGAEKSNGESKPIKLSMGEDKIKMDIGMGAMGKLGDYAWLDLDRDGMQDSGEPGIPGIIIRLFQYGHLSSETMTDDYGRYLFTNLYPGSYSMEVDMPAEIIPTLQQSDFPLVASVLIQNEEQPARAEGILVPSGDRNLNCDLGFVLKQDGRYPDSLLNLPSKDWTRVNEQNPQR